MYTKTYNLGRVHMIPILFLDDSCENENEFLLSIYVLSFTF